MQFVSHHCRRKDEFPFTSYHGHKALDETLGYATSLHLLCQLSSHFLLLLYFALLNNLSFAYPYPHFFPLRLLLSLICSLSPSLPPPSPSSTPITLSSHISLKQICIVMSREPTYSSVGDARWGEGEGEGEGLVYYLN